MSTPGERQAMEMGKGSAVDFGAPKITRESCEETIKRLVAEVQSLRELLGEGVPPCPNCSPCTDCTNTPGLELGIGILVAEKMELEEELREAYARLAEAEGERVAKDEALRDIENTFNCRNASDWSDGYAKAMLRESIGRALKLVQGAGK